MAFDGAEWLVLDGDWETGTILQAFMWWKDNQCYFSMGMPTNDAPASSGTCTIAGHRTVRYYQHQ